MAQATPRPGIIDCDVHPGPKQIDEIKAFMKPPFKDRYSGGGRGFFVNPGAPWADMARAWTRSRRTAVVPSPSSPRSHRPPSCSPP